MGNENPPPNSHRWPFPFGGGRLSGFFSSPDPSSAGEGARCPMYNCIRGLPLVRRGLTPPREGTSPPLIATTVISAGATATRVDLGEVWASFHLQGVLVSRGCGSMSGPTAVTHGVVTTQPGDDVPPHLVYSPHVVTVLPTAAVKCRSPYREGGVPPPLVVAALPRPHFRCPRARPWTCRRYQDVAGCCSTSCVSGAACRTCRFWADCPCSCCAGCPCRCCAGCPYRCCAGCACCS